MTFTVVVQRLAVEDLTEAYLWAARESAQAADRWLDRFQASLQTLDHNPERCPFARENEHVDVEIREFLFGKRPCVFRVMFTVDGETVRILRIRRAQRRFLTRSEVAESLNWDE
jgi:plasmid stabilization system protein ParE